jgi:glucose-1-phosphate thymidylyltransferase
MIAASAKPSRQPRNGITGVILAGGRGSRLDPLTRVINKHLLPVHDQPMLIHALGAMSVSGIGEVVVVTNGHDLGAFRTVVGDPRKLGLGRIEYVAQHGPRGVADALLSAEPAVHTEALWVMLGDNLFGRSLASHVEVFANSELDAMLLTQEMSDGSALRSMGVARFEGDRLVEIVEKPATPASRQVVVGAYGYRRGVFEVCRSLSPSARGELEITDLNNALLRSGRVMHHRIAGWWADAGTFDSLHAATQLVQQLGVNLS